jgi:hypothetical protein
MEDDMTRVPWNRLIRASLLAIMGGFAILGAQALLLDHSISVFTAGLAFGVSVAAQAMALIVTAKDSAAGSESRPA